MSKLVKWCRDILYYDEFLDGSHVFILYDNFKACVTCINIS